MEVVILTSDTGDGLKNELQKLKSSMYTPSGEYTSGKDMRIEETQIVVKGNDFVMTVRYYIYKTPSHY